MLPFLRESGKPPDKRVRAVRPSKAVVGLRAEDVARGRTPSEKHSDPVVLEYTDHRDTISGMGYGVGILRLILLPIGIATTGSNVVDDPGQTPALVIVSGVMIGAGLALILWGSLADSPMPEFVSFEDPVPAPVAP